MLYNDLFLHFLSTQTILAFTLGFSLVHGNIGVLNQGVGIITIIGIYCNADAGGHIDLLVAQCKWRLENADNLISYCVDIIYVPDMMGHNQELITAEA